MKPHLRAAFLAASTVGAATLVVSFLYYSVDWVDHIIANRYLPLRMLRVILHSFTDQMNRALVPLLPVSVLYALVLLAWRQLLRGLISIRIDQPASFTRHLVALGLSILFVAAAGLYANRYWLPEYSSPLSLAGDVVVLFIGLLLGMGLKRIPWEKVFSPSNNSRLLLLLRSSGVAVLGILVAANLVTALDKSASASDRPNVVWIVIDALRADHLGVYGYDRNTSPFLDGVATEGVRFERAFSQEAYTMASVASYFTSTHPIDHNVLHDLPYIDTLHPRFVTIAEVLRDAGYSTVAFVYNPHLKAKFNFGQGFDVYDDAAARRWSFDPSSSVPYHEWYETARDIVMKVTEFLARSPRAPIFLYLHYLDVHSPYAPPPPYDAYFLPEGRTEKSYDPSDRSIRITEEEIDVVVSQYDGEIRYADEYIRKLFELLETHGITKENTLTIVTADHGEEFLDSHPKGPAGVGHGRTLYEEQIHVPLLMLIPDEVAARAGIPEVHGTTIEEPVGLIDVMPTVLELLAIDVGRFELQLQGSSLVPVLRGEERGSKGIYSGGLRSRGSLVLENWKYYRHFGLGMQELRIRNSTREEREPIEELYDLRSNPGETVNLFADRQEIGIRMRQELAAFERRFATGQKSPSMPLDPTTLEELRALGYTD